MFNTSSGKTIALWVRSDHRCEYTNINLWLSFKECKHDPEIGWLSFYITMCFLKYVFNIFLSFLFYSGSLNFLVEQVWLTKQRLGVEISLLSLCPICSHQYSSHRKNKLEYWRRERQYKSTEYSAKRWLTFSG